MVSLKPSHPALYRAGQFFAALKASLPIWAGGGLSAGDEAVPAAILMTPTQQHLFNGMSPNDRRHAIAVARTLQQAGYTQPALLQAALLHDVGKSLGQPVIYRVAIVFLEAFWPAALARLSASQIPDDKTPSPFILHPSSFPRWRRPFVIHAQHPAIGAAWAKEAGCDLLAVRLIARHQDSLTGLPLDEADNLLAVLQWADDLN